jgi:nitrogen regulatory protein P-II 1
MTMSTARILIVDDEPDIASLMKVILEYDGSFNNVKEIVLYMRRIDLIISHEHFLEVSELLRKYDVDGMTFYSVKGRGRSRQEEVSSGEGIARTVPEFVAATRIEVIVENSVVKSIIEDVRTILSKSSFPFGKIFVSDIAEAYTINTNETGKANM